MASITISNLHLSGSDLLIDSETFLNELSSSDLGMGVKGGISPFIASVALSYVIGKDIWGKR
jgi:hypothetical protein